MSVTPDFIGQIYKDTATGNLWRANSLTAGDWTLELQNSLIKWEPTTLKFTQLVGYDAENAAVPCDGITNVIFEQVYLEEGCIISGGANTVQTISYPNLTSVGFHGINHSTCGSLTSISAPLLQPIYQSRLVEWMKYAVFAWMKNQSTILPELRNPTGCNSAYQIRCNPRQDQRCRPMR